MAYRIAQFRYYGDNNPKNYSPDSEVIENLKTALYNGTAFNKFVPISKIGIQTYPGAKVVFNKNTYPVIIGSTGIFELDLDDSVNINDIRFTRETLNKINENSTYYLIVDIIYEGSDS